jgi:prolyl oligopeptidase
MLGRKSFLACAVAALAVTSALQAQPAPSAPAAEPYEFDWLDQVEGERALAWARQQNERTLGELTADPRYQRFHDRALQILQARDRIPGVQFRPDGLHNFWQDQDHVRGLWRRTSMASYRTANPTWETILDIDALASSENANWVYRGATCLPPEETRCLVILSDGGKDASEYREFDTRTKQFVPGGFRLPVDKQSVSWIDQDTLLVARNWGEGTVTGSSYPFVIKRLRRGQDLAQAEEVYRGQPTDVRADPFVLRDRRGTVHAVGFRRSMDFFNGEYHLLQGDRTIKLDLPTKASPAGIVDGRLLVTSDEAWQAHGTRFPADGIVSYDLEEWKRAPNAARPTLVWAPGNRQTLSGLSTTRDSLIVTTLDNVRGRAMKMDYEGGRWVSRPIALPANATISLAAASGETNEAMFSVTDYLTPTNLLYYNGDTNALETLKTTPPRFNAANHQVVQYEATSRDGTKVPYFLVRPRNMRMDGTTPTLLYGYGGFQVPQLPGYNANMGALWLEQGNAYVVANLRGGGEFGPEWHQTAQLANKQRTWDDFIAVAEDLVRRRITSPRRLGVVGGSQGGLLVGTAITQRPELFNAAIIQVPLFDMLRYHVMGGAGASWIGEYGDPRIPEQRAWIEGYSPYQRLTPGRTYPTPFILTSTKDDRVHPGHARRAAARLGQLGQPYYYYENIDGGHSAAANLRESARRLALEYTYASKRLVDGDTSAAPGGELGR